jgi:hypothetical protein
LLVHGYGIGNSLVQLWPAASVIEGLDMEENALTPTHRVDKAIPFFVIPGRYCSFGTHIGVYMANVRHKPHKVRASNLMA